MQITKEQIMPETLESFGGSEYRARVYLDRYAWQGETRWEQTVDRILSGLRELPEYDVLVGQDHEQLRQALLSMAFVPGGRIIHTVGTGMNNTLYNCVTLPRPEDSIEGIMRSATEIATCLKRGAGVGIRLDSLRANGSTVQGSRGTASGSVSFGSLFNEVAGTISQGGSRRGAMLLGHRFNHPDIMDFINIKRDLSKWQNVNTTVFVSEENWQQRKSSPTWQSLIESAHATGEPGLLFMDRASQVFNGTQYNIPFEGVNACSEVLLPAYGCCLLGALNLSHDSVLGNPRYYTDLAIIFLHLCHLYALKHDLFPLPQSRAITEKIMKIGLGVMGLAHGMIKKGIVYGTPASIEFVDELFDAINDRAYATSTIIATKLNTTTPWNRANLDLLSCPPTGTISRLAGTTNGIEPIFRIKQLDRNRIGEFIVEDPLYASGKYDPKLFVDASSIHPIDRVQVQAAIQRHLDNAISSTVNLPHDATPAQVEEIFTTAHDLGCVSITVYRDGSRENVYVPLDKPKHNTTTVHPSTPGTTYKRPFYLHGHTYKFVFGNSNLYISINYDDAGKPIEAFVNAQGISEAWSKATTILLSRLLQHGDDPNVIAEKLSKITNSDVTCFVDGHCIPSQPAAIGYALNQRTIGRVEDDTIASVGSPQSRETCPACGYDSLQRVGRCTTCTNCSHTTCD